MICEERLLARITSAWRDTVAVLNDRIAVERIRRQRAEELSRAWENAAMHVQARNEKLERRIMELEGKKTLNECKPLD
jgi:hypothetical protein